MSAESGTPPDSWVDLVESMSLDGAVRQLAAVCSLSSRTPEELTLTIARKNSQLLTDRLRDRLEGALRDSLGDGLRVVFDVQQEAGETLEDRQRAGGQRGSAPGPGIH